MADYSFTNAPAPEDSIKFRLVRWLTSGAPEGQMIESGQLWLSPEVKQSDLRFNLVQ
ncbi:MAG: hypothetical protein WAT35_01420 [Tabrizicola sp.]|uniref:hypothetical protein n=1 Tax=Tabrizicola sp. TaxID=2005166 RepID=UPI001B6AEF3C|nr:hypothetical protein [Tabrizicola sp.]MCC6518476.1 hypothetical protein [Tabrizicola sp.]